MIERIFCAAGVLSATPLTYSLRRDDSDSFAERFGGERSPCPALTRFSADPLSPRHPHC
jgi:hypothetical protein